MARVTIIQDDLTGVDLDDNIEPTIITVDGTGYSMDLGSASKERLVRWLNHEDALYTPERKEKKEETTETPAAAPSTNKRLTGERAKVYKAEMQKFDNDKKAQRSDMQEWAKTTTEFKDYTVPERVAPNAAFLTAYYKANPEQTQFYGADAVAAPNNKDYFDVSYTYTPRRNHDH